MAAKTTSQSQKTLTHIYVRDPRNGVVRPCWRIASDIHCGVCLNATIQPVLGALCPHCSSKVERILESEPGGIGRPKRKGVFRPFSESEQSTG